MGEEGAADRAALMTVWGRWDAGPGFRACTGRSLVWGEIEADRAISIGKLHALLHFHFRPIDVVVCHGPDRETLFQGGFPA